MADSRRTPGRRRYLFGLGAFSLFIFLLLANATNASSDTTAGHDNFAGMLTRPTNMSSSAQTPYGTWATHEIVPEADGPPNGGTVQVGDRFVLDLVINSGGYEDVVVQQAYLTFTNSVLQNARVSQIGTSCVLTNTVTGILDVFDATLQNEVCNGPGICVFRGQTFPPGSIAYASGALSNCLQGCGGTFTVAKIGLCAVASGTAVLHWQFAPPDPAIRDTQILRLNGELANDRDTYTDYFIHVGPTPTFTPQPIPTGVYCTTSNPSGTTNCSPPSTFRDTFTFGTSCYIGHNGTYGSFTVYFEIATTSGGPWMTIDQQYNPSATFPEGLIDYNHTFIENNIPPQYIWYRMRLDGQARCASRGWCPLEGETPPTRICSPLRVAGHLTWEGILQPDIRNEGLTGTLTMCSAGTTHSYTATTNANGSFNVTTDLPRDSYNWWFKGPKSLATSGTLSPSGELGTQKAGDSNDSNIVNTSDFVILRVQFGSNGSNFSADFNNDGAVNAQDFNMLKVNFGQEGALLVCLSRP